MSAKTITTVRFYNYWKLLQLLAPSVDLCIVFNHDGNFIWQSSNALHPQMDKITVLTRTFQAEASEDKQDTVHNLGDNNRLMILQLQDKDIDKFLTVALIGYQPDKGQLIASENRNSVDLLNKTLLTEYALINKVIEKEQELNSIADELTHRYEELNLIYSSDDHVQNISHGRELLKNIVINASNFMDVDFVVAMLPEKNVMFTHSKNNRTSQNFQHLIHRMENEIYMHLKIHKSPVVINRFEDAQSFNIFIEIPYKIAIAPMLNTDNEVIGLMGIINSNNRIDFTNSDRNLLEVLTNKATNIVLHNFDPLTGLENTHSFEMILLDTLKQTWQNDSHHAIASIDIDRMSMINDLGGLETGDYLLKRVAGILSSKVRSFDTVARLSGDRFAVLLKNCDLEEARSIIKKIDIEICEIDLEMGDDVHEVSTSIGLAPISADIKNVSNILSNVETALKAAKEKGRNQIQVFELNDSDLLRRKEIVKWVSKTQAALREDRFEINAQQIHPLSDVDELPHYEILLRMVSEKGEIISPGMFMLAAENFYLMPKIDRWVILNTFKILDEQIKRHGGPVCQVSINLSGQSFTDEDLANYIENLLMDYSIQPEHLCFEVTESAAIANLKEAEVFIQRIRKLGCEFSLDDFGTGQSSFSYLKSLSVNYLKIDGSFVRNILEDPISESLVSAFNQVGHAMQLKTVAEFVSTPGIYDRLKEIGIDYAQGFLLDEPEPLVTKLTKSQDPVKSAGNV